ncbi:MAG: nucleotidyltransferase family protein [Clostridia bacterium]|nr:nucleotidyltransferase family protein [Clostridia bacterium]
MKIAAIIAEYNPFHNGHAYHIAETKKLTGAEAVVAVMSGSFVQRGEPAVADKYLRAHAAVLGGCDLVIELPAVFALGSAQRFACGAVSLIGGMGCVSALSFGSECGDIEKLRELNRAIRSEEFAARQQEIFSEGTSYPAARAAAAREFVSVELADMLSQPNNILALEYINEAERLFPSLSLITVPRTGASHDSMETFGAFSSASALRESKGADMTRFVPERCLALYRDAIDRGVFYVSTSDFDELVLSHLIRLSPYELSRLPDVSEGLENRIYDAARQSQSLSELYERVKSKRFTHSRLRRVIMCAYLGIKKSDTDAPPAYIRVLAQNKTGSRVLREMKQTAALPIITKAAHISRYGEAAQAQFDIEERATRLYAYAIKDREYRRALNDYKRSAQVIGAME